MNNKPIFVTQPTLPPLEKYSELLESAWESGILTHNGPLVQRLEKEMDEYLDLDSSCLVTNGTVALHLALRALDLNEGEVITTPFSWISSFSSIVWEGFDPVFVDADPKTFNIDPDKIEAAITKNTRAILGVHVFSSPCDVKQIEAIAKKYKLKVIYDGAHAFGVNYDGKSIFSWGDISTTSLHATKILNTGEGGVMFASGKLKERIKSLRFFGMDSDKNITSLGTNAKMTEIHAALGLCNLPNLSNTIKNRESIYTIYFNTLCNRASFQKFDPSSYNYSYMPILFHSEKELISVLDLLNKNNVFPRRYFYPSLNEVKALKQYTSCPVSEDLSRRILCMPSYDNLSHDKVRWIAELTLKALK
ncbi:DegT/DnrJ/EryC1/StrS family aminotransferase [Gammaproteobacteria bacterium]|nr:DegT/DnrJ/EryC1/StrS family aminotransferase [Gammaproteobacteria bacterium]